MVARQNHRFRRAAPRGLTQTTDCHATTASTACSLYSRPVANRPNRDCTCTSTIRNSNPTQPTCLIFCAEFESRRNTTLPASNTSGSAPSQQCAPNPCLQKGSATLAARKHTSAYGLRAAASVVKISTADCAKLPRETSLHTDTRSLRTDPAGTGTLSARAMESWIDSVHRGRNIIHAYR